MTVYSVIQPKPHRISLMSHHTLKMATRVQPDYQESLRNFRLREVASLHDEMYALSPSPCRSHQYSKNTPNFNTVLSWMNIAIVDYVYSVDETSAQNSTIVIAMPNTRTTTTATMMTTKHILDVYSTHGALHGKK
ncbi:hypothetical protein CHS0354_031960 [Potamilus streckersoni]|uniref:Uncharacterized protein n=1 Tax=Potamilus streckersoni TaxID=2493646 RepID=A0AAE0TL31_9BIVA|nr:hypothetical protein CHS0354_031960 [Potamilus streckersoni]